jgi:hypothetical protein
VLRARPSGEVVAALGDQRECKERTEAIDPGEILPEQREQGRAQVERRPVGLTSHPPARGRDGTDGTPALQAKLLQDGLDADVAGGHLLLIGRVERERLLEGEQVLGAVMASERLGDRLDTGAAALIPQACQEGSRG